MAGLLDFLNSPSGVGLLSAVAGGMTGANRGTPVNNIGRGLASGLMGYQGAQALDVQNKKSAVDEQFKALQMGQLQRQMEQQKVQDAWRAGLPDMMSNAQPKVEQFQPDDPFNQGAAAFGEGVGGQQVGSGMMNVQRGNPQALQDYMLQQGSPFADKIIESQLPKQEEYGTTPFVDASGKAFLIGKQGGMRDTGLQGGNKTKLDTIDIPRQDGSWQMFQTNQDGTPNMQSPIGSPFRKRATASDVNVGGAKIYNEADKKLGAGMGEYAIELRKNADSAYRAADEVNYVVDALQGYGGGPLQTGKAWVGKFAPDTEWGRLASVSELANTVQAKLAPSMRAAGSGATSDFEMKMWMKAVPTLATTEQGRQLMQKYTTRVAERAAGRADIEAQVIDERGRVDYAEVTRRMKAKFGDSFLDSADKPLISGGKKKLPQKSDAKPKFLGFEEG